MTPPVRPSDVESLLEGLRAESWSRRVGALRELTARLAAGQLVREDELRVQQAVIDAAAAEKWEVRKAAALALAGIRILEGDAVFRALDALSGDANRWVSQAASRASRRLRERGQAPADWPLTAPANDPTLQHIARQIRRIGLRSMTPARIYDLATEVGELFYQELAADTAHEIKTLLTPLEGYLVELRRHFSASANDPKVTRYLGTALERLHHIQELIDNLREYSTSSIEARFVAVDLDVVLREALAIGAERGAPPDRPDVVEQRIDLPHGVSVEAVRERLVRAIANLVANAYQAMPDGGTLDVRAKVIGSDFVEVAIRDTGVGMTSEEVEHAMKRFRTTRGDRGGTGLGLPIAQRIIEHDHRGQLSIESERGQGTTAVVVLPLRREGLETSE